ncbi:MAG TPA: CopG family transcriptional regulator [Candidatus Dormibacteraeota bacterium]|jgi:hypothetical protein
MHRTTVMLPDDLARLVELERQRRGVSTADLVRQSLEAFLKPRSDRPRYSFIGIAQSDGNVPAARLDDYLADHWADDIQADSFSDRDADRGS